MPECRIFVSSPGDVAVERTLVASVIERLKSKFGHRSRIRLILWEQYPLDATDSFQPQLPDPADSELFLLIMWRRIGTPLPDSALPEGFDGPLTGTEYEFLAALKGQQKQGKPAILVYRKTDHQSKQGQNQVDGFFERYFTDGNARLSKAFHQFDRTLEFEFQLETHLNSWFEKNLPQVSDNDLAQAQKWSSGNPFQGLKAFRFEQANVYRGRSAAIAESIEKLKSKAAQGQPFLLIMGMSGSGKSSLLRAGILPSLYSPLVVSSVSAFYRGIMRPADVQGDPFAGLVSALCANSADQLIAETDRAQMIKLSCEQPDIFVEKLSQALDQRPKASQMVLAIDQFEELYTSSSISEQTQRIFCQLIRRLVDELGVWVIITMRSDCYHFLGNTPDILEMKKEGGQLDLQPPELFNIRQMITEPAQLAGLHFEQDKEGGPPLNEVIAQSAAKSPEGLPLLEFTLSQLYDSRTASGTLTFACYESLGGIEGAIASHAEHVFSQLSRAVQNRFPSIFNQLVDSSTSGRFTRKWANMNELCHDDKAASFVEAFLNARLLVAERNPEGIEVITLAHESLFRHWPRLARYLESNQNLLQLRNEISDQVKRWIANDKDTALLLNAGKPLEDGKALLKSPLTLDSDIHQLIRLSVKRANRNRVLQYSAIAALVLITVYATMASFSASHNQKVAEQSLAKSQDLIEFLIGDLHGQLAKLGRLDVMQSIGEKAINYFAELDPKQATSENIANRSRALYQIGSVYIELNQYDSATKAFSQSQELLSLLVEQHPQNYDYLFEFSQAIYWVGFAYWSAEKLDEAQIYFEEYLSVAKRLVSLRPDDLGALMEVSYAYSNLGTMAASREQAKQATEYFLASIANSETVLKRQPDHQDALWSSADAYSWLGNTHRDQLELRKAIAYYTSEQRIFEDLVKASYSYQNRYDLLLATNRIMGLKSDLGELNESLEGYYQLREDIQYLVNHDPNNSRWHNTHIFILSSIARDEFLLGNTGNAYSMMQESLAYEPGLPENSELIWADEYAERHYWYWRILLDMNQPLEANNVAKQVMAFDSPQAKIWKIRIANRSQHTIEVERITRRNDIVGPDALVAYLEHAIAQQDSANVVLLSSFVSHELWQSPQFSELKRGMDSNNLSALNR